MYFESFVISVISLNQYLDESYVRLFKAIYVLGLYIFQLSIG